MKNFIIPELGENISSATIVKILIKIGDIVAPDQPVLELETDKATIEVPSDVSGKVVAKTSLLIGNQKIKSFGRNLAKKLPKKI